jgi:hypothetical protein
MLVQDIPCRCGRDPRGTPRSRGVPRRTSASRWIATQRCHTAAGDATISWRACDHSSRDPCRRAPHLCPRDLSRVISVRVPEPASEAALKDVGRPGPERWTCRLVDIGTSRHVQLSWWRPSVVVEAVCRGGGRRQNGGESSVGSGRGPSTGGRRPGGLVVRVMPAGLVTCRVPSGSMTKSQPRAKVFSR